MQRRIPARDMDCTAIAERIACHANCQHSAHISSRRGIMRNRRNRLSTSSLSLLHYSLSLTWSRGCKSLGPRSSIEPPRDARASTTGRSIPYRSTPGSEGIDERREPWYGIERCVPKSDPGEHNDAKERSEPHCHAAQGSIAGPGQEETDLGRRQRSAASRPVRSRW